MTNLSEEQLLREGGYGIKAVYDVVNETFVDSVAVSFVFLLFKYDFLGYVVHKEFFQGSILYLCFEFECLFNHLNLSFVSFCTCTCMWKVIVKNPRPGPRIMKQS